MAIVRAVKSGNWSDPTVWNTGALPTSADDVYSNTFTVTIDTSPTVLRISNAATTGVTVGGGFVASANGVTITANVVQGQGASNRALTVSLAAGSTVSLIGNISAPGVNTGSSETVIYTGAGTFQITGNITGSTSNGMTNGLTINGTGVVDITGTVRGSGGFGGGANVGVSITTLAATVNITGDVYAASVSNGQGYGVAITSNSIVTITGNVYAGSAVAVNQTSGTLNHIGSITPVNGFAGIQSTGSPRITGPIYVAPDGRIGINAPTWFWHASATSPTFMQVRVFGTLALRPLYTADSVGGNPATTNVRSGTVYGPSNELTGTCAVPAANSVAFGVPVDNTTGTAVLTPEGVRSAIGLASANLDAQLDALPTAAENATAVWGAATRTVTGGTIDSVADLDAPTEAEIAAAVRVELTPELARIANASTTQEVADIVEGAANP